MATTDAQLEANRANAQLSTGPKTEEGKAASSQNARTHGLTSATLHIPEHEREAYELHRAKFVAEIDPIGIVEKDLFKNLLDASWRLIRLQRMEDEIFLNEANPLTNPETSKALDRIYRYRAAAERSYLRFKKELTDAQTNNTERDLSGENSILQKLQGLVNISKIRKTFGKAVCKPAANPAKGPVPAPAASPFHMGSMPQPELMRPTRDA